MCDTLVALGNSTEDGVVIFAKNSDRDPDEVLAICYLPRTIHEENEVVQCQYIDIPQVKETNAVILAKPVWFKIGCEMGANEYGLVMGNESVFSKEKYEKERVLLGMELMTLALQRAKTTKQALTIITDLLKKNGQGGVSSLRDPYFIQHNSFIITDLTDAWILETANKFWVAKKVQDIASISNGFTIQDKWDLASPNLVEHAIEMGWCESKSEFSFSECYSDPEKRILSGCLDRQSRTYSELLNQKGQITISIAMNILRSHEKEPFRPDKSTMSSVCGHYCSSSIHQTTGSYIASLSKDLQVHWLTGTSAPCLSVFKPFFFESPEPLRNLKLPSLTNTDESLWWKHEKLHRLTLLDYMNRAPVVKQEHKELEQNLINQVNYLQKNVPQIHKDKLKVELNGLSSKALEQNFILIESLSETVSKMDIGKAPKKVYLKFWRNLSEKNGIILI